jgi:hypothetical protein
MAHVNIYGLQMAVAANMLCIHQWGKQGWSALDERAGVLCKFSAVAS